MNQEEITIVSFYVPNVGALNFIKHTLLELGEAIKENGGGSEF
jgi:hypothetical protein